MPRMPGRNHALPRALALATGAAAFVLSAVTVRSYWSGMAGVFGVGRYRWAVVAVADGRLVVSASSMRVLSDDDLFAWMGPAADDAQIRRAWKSRFDQPMLPGLTPIEAEIRTRVLNRIEGLPLLACRLDQPGEMTRYRTWRNELRLHQLELVMPGFALAGLLLVYPIGRGLREPVRRGWRACRGRCVRCGCRLQGPADPRCPDCGFDPTEYRPSAVALR